ncbi:hypothetical protein ABK046_46590, partial [Streptomyces caeruleatus]
KTEVLESTLDEVKERVTIVYGDSSLDSCRPIGGGVLILTLLKDGDAHGGWARMYDFATSTGELTSPSLT